MQLQIPKKNTKGVLYLLFIEMEGKELVKVGITGRNVEDRVCEILVSMWKRYRWFHRLYVKRYKTVENYVDKESKFHEYLDRYRYKTEYEFSGCTEIFDIDKEHVVAAYDWLVKEGSLDGFAYSEGEGCLGGTGDSGSGVVEDSGQSNDASVGQGSGKNKAASKRKKRSDG
jgi:hypothetical protein